MPGELNCCAHVNTVEKGPGPFAWSPSGVELNLIERTPPPLGGFPIYYVPSSRTVCKRTPLEGLVPGSLRGVLLHTVLDDGT